MAGLKPAAGSGQISPHLYLKPIFKPIFKTYISNLNLHTHKRTLCLISYYSERVSVPFCVAARRLLSAKGIDYQDIALDEDPELKVRVMAKSGRNTVPQIWFGTDHVGGFNELRDLERLGNLGVSGASQP